MISQMISQASTVTIFQSKLITYLDLFCQALEAAEVGIVVEGLGLLYYSM